MILVIDWERNWRSNGIVAAVLFIIAFALYGMQPKVGATAVKLVSYYDGDSTRILIATVIPNTVMLVWIAVVSGFLVRNYSRASVPDRVPVPAA